jgi:hypothetical protein
MFEHLIKLKELWINKNKILKIDDYGFKNLS